MKIKILQIVIATQLITGLSFSQVTYFHYFDYSSKWNGFAGYFAYNSVCDYSVTHFSFSTEYIAGDTMLGGNWYYKKYVFKKDSILCPSSTYVILYTEGPQMIREDSFSRVYYWDDFNSVEQLRWDFNKSVGDTIGCEVSSIDTIWLGTMPLRRFHCSCSSPIDTNEFIVEGLGASETLCGTGFEYNGFLVCYEKQGITLQVHPAYPCRMMTGLQNFETNFQDYFSISPNPFSRSTTIEIKSEILNSKSEFLIYDVLGQAVHHQTLNSKHETLNTDLPSGIYFYKLKTEKEILGTGKIVIQYIYSSIAFTPGNIFPSKYSSIAPPPVET